MRPPMPTGSRPGSTMSWPSTRRPTRPAASSSPSSARGCTSTSSGGRPRSSSRARWSSCARRSARRWPSSGGPTATGAPQAAGRDGRALPGRAPRGRPRRRRGGGGARRPRVVADLPSRARAGRALVRLSPRPGGLGRRRRELQPPPLTCGYGNGAAQRRSRAARPPSGRAARPDLGVQPERRRRSHQGSVRLLLPASPRPAPKERRGVHPPSGRRRDHLRRAEARRRDDRRGPAARRRRGHAGRAGRGAGAVRRGRRRRSSTASRS